MNVLLLNGTSGVGKTTIAKKLVEMFPSKYNIIRSYTTRQRRDQHDDDHIFMKKSSLIIKMLNHPYVARTEIDNNIYCAFRDQFIPSKINIYIVDDWGVIDVLNSMSHFDSVKVVRIIRENVSIDKKRQKRFSSFLPNNCPHISNVIDNSSVEDIIVEIEALQW